MASNKKRINQKVVVLGKPSSKQSFDKTSSVSNTEGQEKKFPYALTFIIVLLIVQTGFIIYLAYGVVYTIPSDLNLTKNVLNKKIDTNNADLESKINELTKALSQTQNDLGKQISLIQADTSSDFSGLIQTVVKSVVTIRTDVAQGTGFIITPDGYVVTNAHVLSGASYAEALTSDKEIKDMRLIGYDTNADIALLKINGSYDYLELRNSDEVRVGEKVIAIGNPLGLSFSVSEGIVSAINREGTNGLPAYIQTDAALNPGNSGGPLIGTDGKAIGINNYKARGENIGFALESNYIKNTVNEISIENLNRSILI